VPITAGAKDMFAHYFRDGMHLRDVRAERGVPLLLRGQSVIIDQDFMTPEDMKAAPLYDRLRSDGFQWFAAIGFRAGAALWGLTIQSTIKEGPFGDDDKIALAPLSQTLTEAATLATAVGRVALSAATGALETIGLPAIAIGHSGRVLETNAAADAMFDGDICLRRWRLFFSDKRAAAALDLALSRLAVTSDLAGLACEPIVVRREPRRPVVLKLLPVPPAAKIPFLGARAILTLTALDRDRAPQIDLLRQAFGLTPAEARLAQVIAGGTSPEAAAAQLGVSVETARNQLKSVFAKTGTHRQAELVALLLKLS